MNPFAIIAVALAIGLPIAAPKIDELTGGALSGADRSRSRRAGAPGGLGATAQSQAPGDAGGTTAEQAAALEAARQEGEQEALGNPLGAGGLTFTPGQLTAMDQSFQNYADGAGYNVPVPNAYGTLPASYGGVAASQDLSGYGPGGTQPPTQVPITELGLSAPSYSSAAASSFGSIVGSLGTGIAPPVAAPPPSSSGATVAAPRGGAVAQ